MSSWQFAMREKECRLECVKRIESPGPKIEDEPMIVAGDGTRSGLQNSIALNSEHLVGHNMFQQRCG